MTGVKDLYETRRDGTLVLSLHVQPGASRNAVVGRHGDALKVRLAAPAEGGRANRALVRFLADSLGIERAGVELVSGASSRRKRVALAGIDAHGLERWLAAAGAG